MAKCKCKYCGEQLDSKEAFKVVKKSLNLYYCSEDHFNLSVKEKPKMVTCQICRKKIELDAAHKVVVVSKKTKKATNKYYCSEQEYIKEEERKKKFAEDKDNVYYLICDMFGYEIQNTQLFDEWRCWNKLKSNEIIYKYLRENEDYLRKICDRPYDNEYQKIRYFSAILKNSLRDFKPKVEVIEKPKVVVEETIYEAPTQSLNKRRSLDDLEDMF